MNNKPLCGISIECIKYFTLTACIVKSHEQLPEDHCAVNVKPHEEQEISVYANLPVSAFTTDSETGKFFPHSGENAFTSPGSELDSVPGSESDSKSDPGSESDSESDSVCKECGETPESGGSSIKIIRGRCSDCIIAFLQAQARAQE